MIYIETDQPHVLLWPALAFGLDEFWIGLCWLNLEIGWRSGDGDEPEEKST